MTIDDEPGEALLMRATKDLPRLGLIHLFRNEPPHVKGLRVITPEPIQSALDRLFAS